MEPKSTRKIIHIDMDCFFAAVEIRDNPSLRGLPIAVGSPDAPRGVLCTASYEARAFGVRAAMPNRMALAKCPQLRIVPLRMQAYKEESQAIMEIFGRFSTLIQPLSLDEAFIDVSGVELCQGSATLMAKEIQQMILKERGLTASAGIAPNKFLAKIASDLRKPFGLTTIAPHQIQDLLLTLPVEKLWGVGPRGAQKLHELGFHTCGDLQKARKFDLELKLGKNGERLWQLAHGIDPSPVSSERGRKSYSKERTFATDQNREDAWEISQQIWLQLQDSFASWHRHHPEYTVQGMELKMRFEDFHTTTVHQKGIPDPNTLAQLLERALERHPGKIRLLGLGLQLRPPAQVLQLEFDWDENQKAFSELGEGFNEES